MDLNPSPVVKLPRDVIKRCVTYGKQFAETLANPRTESARLSSTVSSHGIQDRPDDLARSKAAECAFCIWAGINIDRLKWATDEADNGTDINWRRYRIDIKWTRWPRGKLIWPTKKRTHFSGKKFDVLVLVRRAYGQDWTLAGWTTKQRFADNHFVAKHNDRFAEGTMVFDGSLWPISHLALCASWDVVLQ